MERVKAQARADWRPGLGKYTYGAQAVGAGRWWREDVRYEFDAAQIDLIESVADELHGMVRESVHRAIEDKRLPSLGLRPEAIRAIEASWADYWRAGGVDERAGGLVGRLRLAYDGRESVRLLGANYDVADGLFCASLVQRNWRDTLAPGADQFNGLHEALVERWEELAAARPGRQGLARAHFTCAMPDPALEGELIYRAAAAAEAGVEPVLTAISDIGWDGQGFTDADGGAVTWLAKLAPWETLAAGPLGQARAGGVVVLEPAWCAVASNHGLLAVLWDQYPGHPNLCRASFDADHLQGCAGVTLRALFGLDAATTRVALDGAWVAEAEGPGDPGGWVWLETPPLFAAEGMSAVIDAWVVAGKCFGMLVREAVGPLLGSTAFAVPHIFRP